MAETIAVDMTLDCTGMSCPMPILKTKKAIDTLQAGQVLKMISTDPGSVPDINAWTRKTGNALLDTEQAGGKYIFYLKKTA
jgi:tRNA 2-thiouridine synthesizing protein A